MKTFGLAAIVATAAAFVGTTATADHRTPRVAAAPISITVSCARYISTQVVWDRPMPVFLDSLMAAGYSPERAESIGNRICRDEAFVGNINAAGQAMQNILVTNPPRGRHGH